MNNIISFENSTEKQNADLIAYIGNLPKEEVDNFEKFDDDIESAIDKALSTEDYTASTMTKEEFERKLRKGLAEKRNIRVAK